jgi:hypothetical protein
VTVPDTFRLNPGVLRKDAIEAKWTSGGKRGGALEFAAADTPPWMEVPSLESDAFPQEATVALWVKVRSFMKEGVQLFTADDGYGPGPNVELAPISIYLNADIVTLELAAPFPPDAGIAVIQDDSAFFESTSVPSFEPGTWALVVLGWSTSQNVARALIRPDGKPGAMTKPVGFPKGFVLKKPTFSVSCFDGVLDEVRYYNRLLSEAEMAAID